jgi:hypothetical protein
MDSPSHPPTKGGPGWGGENNNGKADLVFMIITT